MSSEAQIVQCPPDVWSCSFLGIYTYDSVSVPTVMVANPEVRRGFEVVVDIEIVDQNNPKNPRLKSYYENEGSGTNQ
jgi:hypothetical protein